MHTDTLTAIKTAIETGTARTIKEYLDSKDIAEKPADVRKQMSDTFGEEAMKLITSKIRDNMQPYRDGRGNRIGRIVARLLSRPNITEDDCDRLLGALNLGIAEVIAKKNQIS